MSYYWLSAIIFRYVRSSASYMSLTRHLAFPVLSFKKKTKIISSSIWVVAWFPCTERGGKRQFRVYYWISGFSLLFARILYLKLISKCAEIHSKQQQQHYVYISDPAPTGSLLKCFIQISLNVKKSIRYMYSECTWTNFCRISLWLIFFKTLYQLIKKSF